MRAPVLRRPLIVNLFVCVQTATVPPGSLQCMVSLRVSHARGSSVVRRYRPKNAPPTPANIPNKSKPGRMYGTDTKAKPTVTSNGSKGTPTRKRTRRVAANHPRTTPGTKINQGNEEDADGFIHATVSCGLKTQAPCPPCLQRQRKHPVRAVG
jgi:hypothetical protein